MHCNENFRKGYNKAEQIMPLGIKLYHFISEGLVKNIWLRVYNVEYAYTKHKYNI